MRVDLLVLGAGMAGLTAAAYAARDGASVLVAESAPEVGGNAALAMGKFWTATSLESLARENPGGDERLGRALFETYPTVLEWIGSTGVWISSPENVLHGRGHLFDNLGYLRRCRSLIESCGGWVIPSTTVSGVVADAAGGVRGARIVDADGSEEVIEAPWTLLATGGFQGNRELRAHYLGANAGEILVRANPYSQGDGLRLATGVGAALAGRMDAYYGHLISEPATTFGPSEFLRLSMKFSPQGMLVNTRGRRFTDESLGDHFNAQAVGREDQGRAALIFSEAVREANAGVVADAVTSGANAVMSTETAQLATAVGKWGYDRDEIAKTIEEYHETSPGPWSAIEVRSGITFTQGGIRGDEDGRVLGPHGPIPGLLVAGADMGGVYAGGYAGGLSMAGVFGYRAARLALR